MLKLRRLSIKQVMKENMSALIQTIEAAYKKPKVVDVRSGDTVRVHQKITEGNKERVQVFEGVVLRVARKNSLTSSITVRRVSGGVGVEKTYLLHSPLVLKVEVMKRSKVRRNYLTYLRQRSGKSARLTGVGFDRAKVNDVRDKEAEAELEHIKEETAATAEAEAAQEEAAEAEREQKVAAVEARHQESAKK